MKPERCYVCGWFFLKGEEPIEFEGEYICSPCKTKIKTDELGRQHATQELGSEDKPEKGQALGYKPQHAADGNESGLL